MDASVSFVPGPEDTCFFYNLVRRSPSGQVYAVPGDFMAVSAQMNPPGSEVGQTVREKRTRTENGREITDVMEASVRICAVREPVEIRLIAFSEAHELLKSEVFLPGSVPPEIVPHGQ